LYLPPRNGPTRQELPTTGQRIGQHGPAGTENTDAAGRVFDDGEDVRPCSGQRSGFEEVGGEDRLRLAAQEVGPEGGTVRVRASGNFPRRLWNMRRFFYEWDLGAVLLVQLDSLFHRQMPELNERPQPLQFGVAHHGDWVRLARSTC
jgi:hypothetical protein